MEKILICNHYHNEYRKYFSNEILPYFNEFSFFIKHMCISIVTPDEKVILLSKIQDIELDYTSNPLSQYDLGFSKMFLSQKSAWEWQEGHSLYKHELNKLKEERYKLHNGIFVCEKVQKNNEEFFLVAGVAASNKTDGAILKSHINVNSPSNHYIQIIKKIAIQTFLDNRQFFQRYTGYNLPTEDSFDEKILIYETKIIYPRKIYLNL